MRHDFKSTLFGFWDQMSESDISGRFAALERDGQQEFEADGVLVENVRFERAVDFRYHGQEYVLTVPVPPGPLDMAAVRGAFDDAYQRQYGHNNPEARGRDDESAGRRVGQTGPATDGRF